MKSPKQKSLGAVAIEAQQAWYEKGLLFPNTKLAMQHLELTVTRAVSTAVRARQKAKK